MENQVNKKFQFTTEEEVMFFDTDCGGVVHNIAYLRMIETCRTKLATQLGMNLKSMAETNLFPVVEIYGWIDSFEKVRFWCAFEVRRKSEEKLLITCRQSLALVQMPQGRPQRLPKEWIEE